VGVTSQESGLCFSGVTTGLAEFDGVNRFNDGHLAVNLPLVPLALAYQVVGLRGRDGLLHTSNCSVFKGEVTPLDPFLCCLCFTCVSCKILSGWCLEHCS
jgi:hypothetical protein